MPTFRSNTKRDAAVRKYLRLTFKSLDFEQSKLTSINGWASFSGYKVFRKKDRGPRGRRNHFQISLDSRHSTSSALGLQPEACLAEGRLASPQDRVSQVLPPYLSRQTDRQTDRHRYAPCWFCVSGDPRLRQTSRTSL